MNKERHMTADKPKVGSKIDEMSFSIVGSHELVSIGQTKDRWTMLFVYRGKLAHAVNAFSTS